MGVTESVSAVMWARRRQPGEIAYGIALGHERFSPCELLDQAVEAGRAGFDLVASSDHLARGGIRPGGRRRTAPRTEEALTIIARLPRWERPPS